MAPQKIVNVDVRPVRPVLAIERKLTSALKRYEFGVPPFPIFQFVDAIACLGKKHVPVDFNVALAPDVDIGHFEIRVPNPRVVACVVDEKPRVLSRKNDSITRALFAEAP